MTIHRPLVAVLGRGIVDADTPILTADDLGATRGDGCFDSTLVTVGDDGVARASHLVAHLDRLDASAAALDIAAPPRAEWAALLDDLLAAWHAPGEATLKLVLTRGREWAPGRPTAYATLVHKGVPTGSHDPHAARRGISIVTLTSGHPSDAFADAPWLLGGVKTLSYARSLAAQREAARRGADDVLFVSTDGYCLDGPTSGLIVADGHRLRTTPVGATGLLASVTVDAILAAARAAGWGAEHELVPVADLRTADGVWLVSSSRGPAPVHAIDGEARPVDPDLAAAVRRFAGF